MTLDQAILDQRVRDKRVRYRRILAVKAVVDTLPPDEKDELLSLCIAEMELGAESSTKAIAKPEGYTIKRAIVEALRDGSGRTAGDVTEATLKMHPWVNKVSIPAAIARLVTAGALLQRGKNGRGYPKYVLNPFAAKAERKGARTQDK